jgi:hypothetical protein
MLIEEVVEAVTPAYAKSGNKTVRKYRCTTGPRKGRIVAKAATCNAPINVRAKQTMKRTRARTKSQTAAKTRRTKRTNPTSKRVARINRTVHRTKNKRRRRSGSRGRKI